MQNNSNEFIGQSAGELIELAAQIVMAYVAKNVMPSKDLPRLISDVHASLAVLSGAAAPAATAEPETEKPSAAAIKKSVTPDALISFVDGKPYKTLKRHLGLHGLDAHSYRARYSLPNDYPMTAPSYSEQRSALAKAAGLGRPGVRANAAG